MASFLLECYEMFVFVIAYLLLALFYFWVIESEVRLKVKYVNILHSLKLDIQSTCLLPSLRESPSGSTCLLISTIDTTFLHHIRESNVSWRNLNILDTQYHLSMLDNKVFLIIMTIE